MFIATLLYRRSLKPDIKWWAFAVRYDFSELEEFCLDAEQVKMDILSKLRDPQLGVGYLLNDAQLPLAAVNKLISKILSPGAWGELINYKRKEEEVERFHTPFRFGAAHPLFGS
jgi:hypothetical protein